MIPLAADENLDGAIVRGVLRRDPAVDLVRIQDAGLSGAEDPLVLEWAAREGRVLLTHDVATITAYAYERIREGKAMPGVIEVGAKIAIGQAIEDILLIARFSLEGEWSGQILYLPLR